MDNFNTHGTLARVDGSINADNPIVCTALIDGIGQLLCSVMHELKNDEDQLDALSDSVKGNLDTVFQTLQLLRNNIGVDQEWGKENLSYMVADIYAEAEKKRALFANAITEAMIKSGFPADLLPPEMRPKLSAADAADEIINQLRSDGVIG